MLTSTKINSLKPKEKPYKTAAKFVQILSSFDPPENLHFNFLKQFLTELDSLHDYNFSVRKIAKKNAKVGIEVLNPIVSKNIPQYEADTLKSKIKEWEKLDPTIIKLDSYRNLVALIESNGVAYE